MKRHRSDKCTTALAIGCVNVQVVGLLDAIISPSRGIQGSTRLFSSAVAVLLLKPLCVYECYISGFDARVTLVLPLTIQLHQRPPSTRDTASTCISKNRRIAKSSPPRPDLRGQLPSGASRGFRDLLSRAYYHPVEPAGPRAQFPSDTVSAIQEKGENWLCRGSKCYDCGRRD